MITKKFYYSIYEDCYIGAILVYFAEKEMFDKEKHLGYYPEDEDEFFNIVENYFGDTLNEFSESVFEVNPDILDTVEEVELFLSNISNLERNKEFDVFVHN